MLRCSGMEFTTEFKDYVGMSLKYLRRELYMGEYMMDVEYCEECEDDKDGITTYAMIYVDDSYLTMRIKVYGVMQEWYDGGRIDKVAMTLLHEMCHIFTEPLWYWARYDCSPSQEPIIRRDNERQVQRIANVIGWLLPKDWYSLDRLKEIKD